MYCEVRRYKNKKKMKYKRILIISIIVGIILFFTIYFFITVNRILKNVSNQEVKSLFTVYLNTAANEVIDPFWTYTDFLNIEKDVNGDIILIQANSVLVNSIARNTVLKAQGYMDDVTEYVVSIPLGTLTGFNFLTGRGPKVNFKIMPVAFVSTDMISTFSQAGINQTKHSINLDMKADINIVLPGSQSKVILDVPILISESIIPGKVPNVYLGTNSMSSLLNLVP